MADSYEPLNEHGQVAAVGFVVEPIVAMVLAELNLERGSQRQLQSVEGVMSRGPS